MSKVIDSTSRMELQDSPLAIFMPTSIRLGREILGLLDKEDTHPFAAYACMSAVKKIAIDKLLENIDEVPNKDEVLAAILSYCQQIHELEIKNIKEKMNA